MGHCWTSRPCKPNFFPLLLLQLGKYDTNIEEKTQDIFMVMHFFARIALCVIFTILVSFSRDNALFASKAKINVVLNIFKESQLSEKKISNNIDFSL